MNRKRVLLSAALVAFLFAVFVWPTPWVYKTELRESPFQGHEGEWTPVSIRVNRLTGQKQMADSTVRGGWGPDEVW